MKKGWEYKRLKDVGLTQTGSTPSKLVKSYYGGDVPFIRPAELNIDNNGAIEYNSEIKLTAEGVSKSRLIKANSILMCCIGSVGKTGYSKYDVTCNQQINSITPYIGYFPKFVYYALLSPEFQKKAITIANSAKATLPIISKGKWEELQIPVPPLTEQQSIVSYLDAAFAKIDAMKANAEKALSEAKALFQASLRDLLTPKKDLKWSTIGDIFETYSGGTPTKSNKEYYEGGIIPWLRSGEVCQKDITETEMFITEKGLKESSAKYYPENTVVVAMYGATAAQVGILRIKSTSNQAVCGILPSKDFLPEFVYYWFSSIEDKLAAQAQGGAQPNISQQKIKKVSIPLYSLADQQTIVSTLDSLKSKVDRLQANYEQISGECGALKQAILRQVFE